MIDLDHLAVILTEMRRNRQQLQGMLPERPHGQPGGVVERQLNGATTMLSRAILDLRLALELADPGHALGGDVVIDIQAARRP